jgi:oleate hydratase
VSWAVKRQPHFKEQHDDPIVVWVYGLYVDRPGDFIKKTMQESTGE